MRNIYAALSFTILLFVSCKKDHGVATILNNPSDGQIVVSTYSGNYTAPGNIMILDKDGYNVFQKTTTGAAINFRKWQVNGKTRYTYMEFDPNTPQLTQGILPTTAVVLNENFQEIKRVRLIPYNGRSASDPSAVDAHDFIYIDDNHFITLSYFQKVVNNIPASLKPVDNCKVVAAVIQEIVDDQVVWEWDSSDFPEFYLQSVEGNVFGNANIVHDYVHMNSIFVDPRDNNLICSMRNTNQVIKISRTDGHIVWRLGGTNSDFEVTADMKFLRQHNATLTDDNQTLMLVDNGQATERPSSRILEFRLNEIEKSVNSFKAFSVPQNIFIQFMGSVQKRGDTYFIGCGSVPKVLEVNYVTNKITFLMDLPNNSYRALKD